MSSAFIRLWGMVDWVWLMKLFPSREGVPSVAKKDQLRMEVSSEPLSSETLLAGDVPEA